MSKRDKLYSHHHILPKSLGGASSSDNIILLPDAQHRAIHTLFDNKMIAEQLIKTIDLSKQAMREDVIQMLMETLTSLDIEDPYARYKISAIKH